MALFGLKIILMIKVSANCFLGGLRAFKGLFLGVCLFCGGKMFVYICQSVQNHKKHKIKANNSNKHNKQTDI